MQHMVNKAHTRWVAANLISGNLAHAGNHRHGTAGHSQGRCSAPKAVVWAKPMAFGQGVVVTGGYRSSHAMQCGATVRQLSHTYADLSAKEGSPPMGGYKT